LEEIAGKMVVIGLHKLFRIFVPLFISLIFIFMSDSVYNLDVALDIIANLFILRDKQLEREENPLNKVDLIREKDMLAFEKEAIYSQGELQTSIIDKAFRLYAPILKQHYAAN
jgi:hypothetical protein